MINVYEQMVFQVPRLNVGMALKTYEYIYMINLAQMNQVHIVLDEMYHKSMKKNETP